MLSNYILPNQSNAIEMRIIAQNLTIFEGEMTNLNCEIRSFTPVNVSWFHNDHLLIFKIMR